MILAMASCKKSEESSFAKTRFTYTNATSYTIDINVYKKALDVISFNYKLAPHDSLSLDFNSLGAPATPFGAPEVDSAEVVFDGGRRLIYTVTGPNGTQIPRNIFLLTGSGSGYQSVPTNDASNYKYNYEFTNTDYFNAR
jgi:hypothetical protein